MKKISLFIGLFFVCFGLTSTANTKQLLDERIKTGEELSQKWDYQGAVDVYEKTLVDNPGNFELLWRLAHNYIKLGLMTKDIKQRTEFYEKAAIYAEKAIAVDDKRIEGYLWLAVAQGRLALLKGGKEKVILSKNVKAKAEKALEIDPDNDIALHVLGSWHLEAATLPSILKVFAKVIYGGLPPYSIEEARMYLEKAVAINPGLIEHHLELGNCYKALKKWELAKKEWSKCLELTPLDAYDKDFQEEAKTLLSEYKNRK
ncbi:MAG: hypothetical protein NC936_05185 [Candidatus Omnitrophica bacterium]|nr:hypothetical protein [Candidatus Omnitrophota bacterium]